MQTEDRKTRDRRKPKNENLMLFSDVMEDAGLADYVVTHEFLKDLGVQERKIGKYIYVNRRKYLEATANI